MFSCEYLRKFSKKFETVLMGYPGAGGKHIDEKNQKQKISWHCPFKMTICKGMCTLKCTGKRVILFTPLHLLHKFVPHAEFKGSPAYDMPNVFYSTSFKNYPSFSLQVPSILSIPLGFNVLRSCCTKGYGRGLLRIPCTPHPTTYSCFVFNCIKTTFLYSLLLSYILSRLALCLYLWRNVSPIPKIIAWLIFLA